MSKHLPTYPTFVALLCCLSATALAHGGLPAAETVYFDRGSPSRVYVGTNFGSLVSDDRGASFSWLCEEATGYRADRLTGQVRVLPSGTIFSANGYGVQRSETGGCSYETVPRFDVEWAQGSALSPDGGTLYVVTGRTGVNPALWQSVDDAKTFSAAGLLLDAGYYLSSVTLSPSGNTFYVGGIRYDDAGLGAPVLFRSFDGGGGFEELSVASPGPAELWTAAVSPADESVLFAALPEVSLENGGVATLLLRSVNAGRSWQRVLELSSVLRDVDVSADGGVVTVAALEGLFRSDNGGQSFVRLARYDGNGCAVSHPDGLFLCALNHGDAGFALSVTPPGAAEQIRLRLEELKGPAVCPAGTEGERICPSRWPALQQQLRDLRQSGGDAGTQNPADGGVSRFCTADCKDAAGVCLDSCPGGTEPTQSCGCSSSSTGAANAGGAGHGLALPLAFLLLLLRGTLHSRRRS